MKVHRVTHLLRRGEVESVCISDLIFVEGTPLIVLEWSRTENGEIPAVTVPLDLKFLHKTQDATSDYLYEHRVEDPRKFS